MPLAAIAGIGIAGALGGAAISSNAAGNAASTQANAANTAANLQHQDAEQALQLQQQQFNATQQNQAPWLQAGQAGLSNLSYLLGVGPQSGIPNGVAGPIGGAQPAANYAGQSFNSLTNSGDPNVSPNQQTTQQWKAAGVPFQNITTSDGKTVAVRTPTPQSGPQAAPAGVQGAPQEGSTINPSLGGYGSLSQGWNQQFQAPTNVTEQNDPGFQFRLQQGEDALQRSAAAKGGLLSGGTAKALNDYAQNDASNEYGNVYNRALGEYQQNYNQFQNNQTNQYNRLASLSGLGQTTAAQLGQQGQQSATNSGNILLASGQQQGQDLSNAAAATASGYAGSASAYNGALGGIGNNLTTLALLGRQGGVNLSGIPSGGAVPGLGGYNPYGP